MTTRVVQAELRSGTARRVCWLPALRGVRPGAVVTLRNSEDPTVGWQVLAVSAPRERAGVRDDWRVGGIDPGTR